MDMHPALKKTSITLIDYFPYFAEFFCNLNITETDQIPTAGVNCTAGGFQFYYNGSFLDRLTDKMMNFVMIHELDHLIFNHVERGKFFNHQVANIAMDMIINSLIMQEIEKKFVEKLYFKFKVKRKDKEGKETEKDEEFKTYFVPQEYTKEWIFEQLYAWLLETPPQKGFSEETNKLLKNIQDYKNSEDELREALGNGIDVHMSDTVSDGVKEAMVKNLIERCANRGYITGQFENMLKTLRKSKKDYLREIKRSVSTMIGITKVKSWSKPNRKGLPLKGYKRFQCGINVILDTSGSMGNDFENVLSYIFRNDCTINLIQNDTEVKSINKIKNKKELTRMKISGLGGTIIQPAVDHIAKNFNNFCTCILTDGETDDLDFSAIKKKVIILYLNKAVGIKAGNNIKQFQVESDK
jgi:predicted metal-dependent peptidase